MVDEKVVRRRARDILGGLVIQSANVHTSNTLSQICLFRGPGEPKKPALTSKMHAMRQALVLLDLFRLHRHLHMLIMVQAANCVEFDFVSLDCPYRLTDTVYCCCGVSYCNADVGIVHCCTGDVQPLKRFEAPRTLLYHNLFGK